MTGSDKVQEASNSLSQVVPKVTIICNTETYWDIVICSSLHTFDVDRHISVITSITIIVILLSGIIPFIIIHNISHHYHHYYWQYVDSVEFHACSNKHQ